MAMLLRGNIHRAGLSRTLNSGETGREPVWRVASL